jgi:hypothetical protein
VAEGFISKTMCICGCETLMPQHLVNIGWKYLRGHKPAEMRAGKKVVAISDRKVVLAAPVETSYARTLEMAKQNSNALAQSMKEIDDKIMANSLVAAMLTKQHDSAAVALARTNALIEALRRIVEPFLDEQEFRELDSVQARAAGAHS